MLMEYAEFETLMVPVPFWMFTVCMPGGIEVNVLVFMLIIRPVAPAGTVATVVFVYEAKITIMFFA